MTPHSPDEAPSTDALMRAAEAAALCLEQGGENGDELESQLWEVIRPLRERGGEDVLAAVQRWAQSPHARLRMLAADVAGQLSPFLESAPFRARCEDAILPLLGDTDAEVLGGTIVAIGHLHRVEPDDWDGAALLPFTAHPSADVREACCHALGGPTVERSAKVLDAFVRLIDDSDVDVRNWATFGAGVLCEDLRRDDLTEALARRLDDPSDEVRAEAIHALSLRGDPRAKPVIEACLAAGEALGPIFEAIACAPDAVYIEALRRFDEAEREANPKLYDPASSVVRAALDACENVQRSAPS